MNPRTSEKPTDQGTSLRKDRRFPEEHARQSPVSAVRTEANEKDEQTSRVHQDHGCLSFSMSECDRQPGGCTG